MRPRKPRKTHVPTADELSFRKALGQRIRAWREPRLSQEEFADRIAVYRTHVSTIENGGTDLRLSTLLRIAAVLDVPLGDLLQPKQDEGGERQDL